MLEMLYEEEHLSMIFILPFEEMPLSEVEEAMKKFHWAEFYEKGTMVSRIWYASIKNDWLVVVTEVFLP